MNLGAIDLGDPAKERAAFFGALQELGGLGSDDDMGQLQLVSANPSAYPPTTAVDFPDPDGSYKYRANTDGSFTIVAGPSGVGTKVSSGSKAFDAIQKVYLNWSSAQTSRAATTVAPAVPARRSAAGASAPAGKKKKGKGQKKKPTTTDTVTSIFKGVSEALPGFLSATAEASEAPPEEETTQQEEGMSPVKIGLFVLGGVALLGGAYWAYTKFSAKAAVDAATSGD